MLNKIKDKVLVLLLISILVSPIVIGAFHKPIAFQAIVSEENLNNDNELLEKRNEIDENQTEEVAEPFIEEEKELLENQILEIENQEQINDEKSVEVEESVDEEKIRERQGKEYSNSIINHPKWQDIEETVIPQENSFIPRITSDFFVSDEVGNVVNRSQSLTQDVVFGTNGTSSVILNNVGSYRGENINIKVTVKADFPLNQHTEISVGVGPTNFLSWLVLGGGESSPVEIKWEFVTDERKPVEVGTYFKMTNLNTSKALSYSEEDIRGLATVKHSTVQYHHDNNNLIVGSRQEGQDASDFSMQLLVIFEVATKIEYSIIPLDTSVALGFNRNPRAEVEIADIQNIDTRITEFTNEEDIILEWSVLQEIPFITGETWYANFTVAYNIPDSLINSELWSEDSEFEVIVKNSLNQNVTNLFTQKKQGDTVEISATETALKDSSFYDEIYRFFIRLHIDNDASIKEELLDDSRFLVTKASVYRANTDARLVERSSSTVAGNRANFNSTVTLNLVTPDGGFLENRIIEDILTHEITINPPKIEGYVFDYVKEDIDLRNIQLNSTNMSLELVYEQMIQPDIPAINPEDGTFELENTNPNSNWLAIRYASSLDFGEASLVENGQELFSRRSIISQENREIPNMVTIQDMRPEDQREGWQLQVRKTRELAGGAQIIMSPYVHESYLTENNISVYDGDFIPNTDSQIFASASEKNSNQIVSFGMHDPQVDGVRLLIPPGMGVGSYQTNLHWNLVSGPAQMKEYFTFSFSGTEGNSEATVTGYNGSSKNASIPSEVINTAAGWTLPTPVTSIGDGALRSKGLTSLQIPNSITSIGYQALRENQLKTISLPNSLITIGNGALEHNQFTEIEIPNTVTSIGEWAFNDNQLTTVRMSNSVQTIGNLVFRDNPLSEIIVESEFEVGRMKNLLTPTVMNRVTAPTVLRTNEQEFYQLDNINSNLWNPIKQIEMKHFYQSENLASYSLDVLDNSLGFSNSQSTGVYKRANDTITIYVDEETDQVDMPSYTITPIVLTTYTEAVWGATGRSLQKGINVIDNTSEGIIHIRNTSKITPSQHIAISFEGGLSIPRYILGETTEAEWQETLKNRHPETPGFELVGRQTMITGGAELINNIQDPKAILELHDTVVDMHNETSGLDEDSDVHRLPQGLIQHLRHTIDPTAYMYAWGQHTGYNTGAMRNTVLNPNLEQWGVWHEMGHTYQVNRMNFSDLTEVTVNIYSMRAQKKLGQRSRLEVDRVYTDVFNYLNRENRNFHGLGFWEKLTMFWQLELAFGEEFYPQLHRLYREERRTLNSNMDRQQYFIEASSRISQTNLTPFFEAWGIEVSTATKDKIQGFAKLETDIWLLRDEL